MSWLNPPVLWAQRKDRIYLTVYLTDINSEKFSLEGTKFVMSCVGGENQSNYSIEFDLFKEIVPEESVHKKTAREMFFSLKKKEDGPYWPRLLGMKQKPHFLKVDFNRWRDEDDSGSEDEGFNEGLESMMSKMDVGGSNTKFDPGNETDSDDEPLPELES